MGLLKKIKKAKGKIESLRGDGNALKSKFGIGRSFSNKFDQRISDGLEDLLGGILGVRTSNLPEIGKEVKDAREANRKERMNAINERSQARENAPIDSTILVFPKQYFNEKGEIPTAMKTTKNAPNPANPSGEDVDVETSTKAKMNAKGGTVRDGFPNSIHFRSLPRKKVDASEAGKKLFGGNKGDAGTWGSVDPSKEPIFDIFLYLPHDLGDGVAVEYEEAEGGMMDTFFANLFSGGDTSEMMGERNFDMNEVLKMIQGMLPGGAIIQKAAGAMANPMKFQSFKGVSFRDYTYKFTLKPSNPSEAQTIKGIIAAFKYSTLPGTAGENDRIWTMPNEWAVKFQGPIRNWVDFPLTVVCKSVDVNYAAGGGYVLMEDGAPQAIELTVQFQETTQISRQKFMHHVSAATGEHRDFGRAEMGTKVNNSDITRWD